MLNPEITYNGQCMFLLRSKLHLHNTTHVLIKSLWLHFAHEHRYLRLDKEHRYFSNLILWLGYIQLPHTHMSEAVSRQVVALKKPLVTHGASVRLHPYTHTHTHTEYCIVFSMKTVNCRKRSTLNFTDCLVKFGCIYQRFDCSGHSRMLEIVWKKLRLQKKFLKLDFQMKTKHKILTCAATFFNILFSDFQCQTKNVSSFETLIIRVWKLLGSC